MPDPVTFCIAQDMVALRADELVVDSTYLYYRLRARDVQASIESMHVGTMIPHFKRGDFNKLRFRIHSDVREQRRVAAVLRTLDDKISANHRTLTLLDDLAFARFDAQIASDRRLSKIEDLADFHNRRRIPLSARDREARRGDVPYYGAAGQLDSVDSAIFEESLVLVGEDGSVIRDDGRPVVQYVWGPSWVNNHAHVLTGRTISTELLHIAIRRSTVTHLVTGAVQPKISMGNLKSLLVEIPHTVSLLDRQLQEIAGASRSLTEENLRLAWTRDELLPLFMSGKIRVRDAERQVEDAL